MVFVVLLGAALARSWLHWQSPYVPGMNGAYYLIQARALLDRGTLGVPDLPLTFMLQAGFARLLMVFGLTQSTALLTAVKLCDGLLPALLAVPVWWLAREWCRRLGRDERLALAPATLVTLSGPPLSMVGDFQKNSLALLWLALWLLAMRQRLDRPGPRASLAALAALGLLGLTHIGVFGCALVYGAAWLVAERVVSGPRSTPRQWLWPLAAALVAAAAGGLVLARFDPQRIHRLLTALTRPAAFLGDGHGGGPTPSLVWQLLDPVHWLAALVFAAVAVPAARAAWRRRDALPTADVVLILALAAGTIVLTGPWLGGDKLGRFALIAFPQAVLLGSFAVLELAPAARLRRLALGAAGVGVLTGAAVLLNPRGPQAGPHAVAEMAQLPPLVADPAHTVIVARHGTEWWAAWCLHTSVAQPTALRPELWQRFATVLYLENREGDRDRPPEPPPPPPGSRRRPPPPPQGGPMAMPELPASAVVLHRGPYLTLARVDQPAG